MKKIKHQFKQFYNYFSSIKEINEVIENIDCSNLKIVLSSDCDHASLSRHKYVLDSLCRHGIKCTLASFIKLEDDKSALSKHCSIKDTVGLENKNFRNYLLKMRDKYDIEIAYHGYSQISNTREKFLLGLELFKKYTGNLPYTYIEHGGKLGRNKKELCKKESLAYEGNIKNSNYYIFDIIKEKLKITWAEHDYLINSKNIELSLNQFFYLKDDICRFKRQKGSGLTSLLLNARDGEYYFPYTHFNYDYFELSKNNILERWDIFGKSNAIKLLLKLKDNGAKFLTLSEAHKEWETKF